MLAEVLIEGEGKQRYPMLAVGQATVSSCQLKSIAQFPNAALGPLPAQRLPARCEAFLAVRSARRSGA